MQIEYNENFYLFIYGALLVAIGLWIQQTQSKSKEEFLLAKRRIRVLTGSLSVAASWIWGPALFLALQRLIMKVKTLN